MKLSTEEDGRLESHDRDRSNGSGSNGSGEITRWLEGWQAGDLTDRDRLIECIYPRLRQLVRFHRYRRRGEVVQTTELVHDLYVRLVGQRQIDWHGRSHFLAIAGRLLRRIIVDQERLRRRKKRGSGALELAFEESLHVVEKTSVPLSDVLTLDRALTELASIDDRAARVVELRFFAGLTHDETAEALSLGRATVVRSWRFARAWLRGHLEPDLMTSES